MTVTFAAIEEARLRGERLLIVNSVREGALADKSVASDDDLRRVTSAAESAGVPHTVLQPSHRDDLAQQVELLEDRLEGQAGVVGEEQLALVVPEVLAEGQRLLDDLLRAADRQRGLAGELLQ